MGDNVSFCSYHGNYYEGWNCPYCEKRRAQQTRSDLPDSTAAASESNNDAIILDSIRRSISY